MPVGRPWKKGQSGNPAGGRKGARHQRTKDLAQFIDEVLHDPTYQRSVLVRVHKGEAPHLEKFFWEKRAGPNISRLELTGADGGPVEVADASAQVLSKLDRLFAALGACADASGDRGAESP